MMEFDITAFGSAIEQKFHSHQGSSVATVVQRSRIPVVFSHLIRDCAMPDRTLPRPAEKAFAITVHHRPLSHGEIWVDGKQAKLPPVPVGGLCAVDLDTSPAALIREPYEFSRFYMTRSTLDDLCYAHGIPRAIDLRLPEIGHRDPVILTLAQALLERVRMHGDEVDSLFADWISLAFHTHIVRTYGGGRDGRPWRGGLTPRRLKLVSEWMTERMSESLSISEIAAQIHMSPSHFARAFRETTGDTPHQWLTRRRIERAKELIRASEMGLAEIACVCGFSDQSHLTRVFSRTENVTPAAWRHIDRI